MNHKTEYIWTCKIGGPAIQFQSGADAPMRQAVQAAFKQVTGNDEAFCFSGWGGELTEPERAVVENRLPNTERAAVQAAQPGAVGEPIKWTLDGDKTCGYNNWVGETPFGRILITWKGWKEDPDACVDEFPGELPHFYGSPDAVKEAAEAEFNRRLRLAAAPTEPMSAPTAEPDCSGGMPCTTCPDKRKCQRGCLRQVEASENPNRKDLRAECDAVDALLRGLGLDPERCRTEGGALNIGRTLSLLKDGCATPPSAATPEPSDAKPSFREPTWKDEPPDWCSPKEEEIWQAGYDSAMASARSMNRSIQSGPVMHAPSGFTFDTVLAAANPEDLVSLTPPEPSDAERLDWLENNLFNVEPDEWTAKYSPHLNTWRIFAPKGVQGSARTIIDAAIRATKGGKL